MTTYVREEVASERFHQDVVDEIDDQPGSSSEWLDAMYRLHAIGGPSARSIVALHRGGGSGKGERDSGPDEFEPMSKRTTWGCETTSLVAAHYGVERRTPTPTDDFGAAAKS